MVIVVAVAVKKGQKGPRILCNIYELSVVKKFLYINVSLEVVQGSFIMYFLLPLRSRLGIRAMYPSGPKTSHFGPYEKYALLVPKGIRRDRKSWIEMDSSSNNSNSNNSNSNSLQFFQKQYQVN